MDDAGESTTARDVGSCLDEGVQLLVFAHGYHPVTRRDSLFCKSCTRSPPPEHLTQSLGTIIEDGRRVHRGYGNHPLLRVHPRLCAVGGYDPPGTGARPRMPPLTVPASTSAPYHPSYPYLRCRVCQTEKMYRVRRTGVANTKKFRDRGIADRVSTYD